MFGLQSELDDSKVFDICFLPFLQCCFDVDSWTLNSKITRSLAVLQYRILVHLLIYF